MRLPLSFCAPLCASLALLLPAACGGGSSAGGNNAAATATATTRSTSTAAVASTPTGTPTLTSTLAPPTLAVTATPRGDLVVAATTPVGVIRTLPGGTILGGAPAMPAQYRVTSPAEVAVAVIASGLEVPWSLDFAPDGRLFVAERPGRIRIVTSAGLTSQPWATLPVLAAGEGGLMGLALDPDFEREPWVYVCYTFSQAGLAQNRISRLREEAGAGGREQILLDAFPGAAVHDGCRLRFGPDGKLYATTGDASARTRAQDLSSLAGKILRLNRDGTAPGDNPFEQNPAVWSFGHRNPQGLAFDRVTGVLLATEHGPSGEVGIGNNDEVNVIVRGGNYGWPEVVGAPGVTPYIDPLLLYPVSAVPPAGAVFYYGASIPAWQGSFLFTSLRGQHLQRVVLDPTRTQVLVIERLFDGVYGRLRDVIEGPDGALYVATSNRDGRGIPRPDDDRILRLSGN